MPSSRPARYFDPRVPSAPAFHPRRSNGAPTLPALCECCLMVIVRGLSGPLWRGPDVTGRVAASRHRAWWAGAARANDDAVRAGRARDCCRLAELRRRQGLLTEAQPALRTRAPASARGARPSRARAGPRDVAAAVHLVDRSPAACPGLRNRTERAHGLEVAVRITSPWEQSNGSNESAWLQLEMTAALIERNPYTPRSGSRGASLPPGVGGLDAARRHSRMRLTSSGIAVAPFEALQARLDLVPVLSALDRRATAAIEGRAAFKPRVALAPCGRPVQAAGYLREFDANRLLPRDRALRTLWPDPTRIRSVSA